MLILNLLVLLYILIILIIYFYKIQNPNLALTILMIIGIIIIIGWNTKKKDVNKECIIITKTNNNKQQSGILFGGCIDYWHFLHLLLYIIIGLLMPNQYLLIVIISVIWETFEHIAFKYMFLYCNSLLCGRVEDIFLNTIGYTIGSSLTYLYNI